MRATATGVAQTVAAMRVPVAASVARLVGLMSAAVPLGGAWRCLRSGQRPGDGAGTDVPPGDAVVRPRVRSAAGIRPGAGRRRRSCGRWRGQVGAVASGGRGRAGSGAGAAGVGADAEVGAGAEVSATPFTVLSTELSFPVSRVSGRCCGGHRFSNRVLSTFPTPPVRPVDVRKPPRRRGGGDEGGSGRSYRGEAPGNDGDRLERLQRVPSFFGDARVRRRAALRTA